MVTQIKIEKCDKPYCVIHTDSETEGIKAIAKKISSMDETGRSTMLTGWTDFIRISNTDIVNFSKVTKLDMSLTGIVRVNFTNGKDAIVSRRYMSKIKKELLNLKHR